MNKKYVYFIFMGIVLVITVNIYIENNELLHEKFYSFIGSSFSNKSLIIKQILKPFPDSTIFCIILTTQKNLKNKAKIIHETWASKCDNHTFVSLLPDTQTSTQRQEITYQNLFNVLKPAGIINDKYEKLTDKVYATFKDVYSNNKGYQWYLKADDDTFIFMENLRYFLKDKHPEQPVTYGYDFKVIVEHGYHSGGAGYLLSN